MSNDVLSFLSASAEYHLLDVINDASNFRARGKRSRLTVDDVNASLELRGAEVWWGGGGWHVRNKWFSCLWAGGGTAARPRFFTVVVVVVLMAIFGDTFGTPEMSGC